MTFTNCGIFRPMVITSGKDMTLCGSVHSSLSLLPFYYCLELSGVAQQYYTYAVLLDTKANASGYCFSLIFSMLCSNHDSASYPWIHPPCFIPDLYWDTFHKVTLLEYIRAGWSGDFCAIHRWVKGLGFAYCLEEAISLKEMFPCDLAMAEQ